MHHVSAYPEVQGKQSELCECETGKSLVSPVCWTVTAWEQGLAPYTAPGLHTKGTTDPCPLWASFAPLATATRAGDTSQHSPHTIVPSCVAKERCPLLPPLLPLLPCCALSCLATQQGQMSAGAHPLAG